MKIKRLALTTCALIAMALTASPALAEGSWTSYLSNVPVGFESRTWADRDIDQVATTVRLSGCSVSGTTFSSTGITLYQDTWVWIYFTNHGLITNTCNTVSWGQGLGSGNYHLTFERINGSSSTSRTLSATTVVAGY